MTSVQQRERYAGPAESGGTPDQAALSLPWQRPADGKAGRRRRLVTLLKFGVAGLLLYILLRQTPFQEVLGALQQTRLQFVAAALVLNFVGLWILVYRWGTLLRCQNAAPPHLKLFKSSLVAMFFSNFLPSTVGGDAVRIYDSWRFGVERGKAVTVVLVDRFLGLCALLLFAAIGFILLQERAEPLSFAAEWVLGSSLVAIVALGVLFGGWRAPPIVRRTWSLAPERFTMAVSTKIIEPLLSFRGKGRALVQGFGLSVLLQANVVIFYFLLGSSLSLDVSLVGFFIAVPFALFIMMLPLSINGIGLREGAFVVLLGLFGAERAEAIALAWLAYGLTVLLGLVGGAVYAFRR